MSLFILPPALLGGLEADMKEGKTALVSAEEQFFCSISFRTVLAKLFQNSAEGIVFKRFFYHSVGNLVKILVDEL